MRQFVSYQLAQLAPRSFALSFALAILLPFNLHAGSGSLPSVSGNAFFYTFKNAEGGGIAEVVVNPEGRITTHRILLQDKRFKYPHKIAVSPDRRFIAATADQQNLSNLALIDRLTGEASLHNLLRTPDAIEPWRGGFVIGANDGVIYLFQPETRKTYRYNLRQNTYPPARKAEYILIDGDHAWITIQKDSRTQKTKGSRVIYFDLANWRLVKDLMMARDRPDLELNSLRERGPSPEIVLASHQANTLLLSMDRYGGVTLADLDAAREGGWINRSNHSTAPDGSFGTAFPDRWVQFTHRGRDYALIVNAGLSGGAALIDMARREVIQRIEIPPGLENPVWLPKAGLLAAGVPGKVKRNFWNTLEETREPVQGLYTLRTRDTSGGLRLELKQYPIPQVLSRGAAISHDKSFVLFPAKDQILVVDATSGKVVSQENAQGQIFRMAPLVAVQ